MLPRKTKRALGSLGDLRPEGREDAEARLERLPRVQVVRVAAGPEEALSRALLDAREIDTAFPEEVELSQRVVLAHDADDLHLPEEGRRRAEEDRGPPEHSLGAAEGRLDAVQRDASDDEDRHRSGLPLGTRRCVPG